MLYGEPISRGKPSGRQRNAVSCQWSFDSNTRRPSAVNGVGFGSSLVQYVKWAARGFADPAAYVLFLAGFVLLLGRLDQDPRERFARAFGAGLLFALALAVRPNIAPAAGVLLAGAGIAALVQREFARAVGLALGFAPVLALALHNWIYGGAFVLFTTTATHPLLLVMSPSAYLAALGELAHGEVAGEHELEGHGLRGNR